jgi:hemerythrin
MGYVFWSDNYSVHDVEIDKQHQHILSLVNALSTAAASGEGANQADLLLMHLLRYIERHFRAEERLMELLGYPDLNAHTEQHLSCTRRLRALRDAVRAGEIKVLECVPSIEKWLHDHLLGSDQQYSAWVARDKEAVRQWAEEMRREPFGTEAAA